MDINAVIGDVLGLLEHQLETGKVKVRRELSAVSPVVDGVEHKLQQVFLNMFLNARDAMPRGGWLWLSVFRMDHARPTGVLRAEPAPLPGEDPAIPGSRTEAFFQQTFEPATQVTEARFWLDTVAPDGVVRRQATTLRLRWFERFELERLLAAHGFAVTKTWGDFDGSEYGDASPHIVVLARKR